MPKLLTCLLIGLFIWVVPCQGQDRGPIIEIGDKIEREIATGEKHSFRFVLKEQEFVRITARTSHDELTLTVVDAQGISLLKAFHSVIEGFPAEVFFVAPQNGVFSLEVTPSKKPCPTHFSYQLLFGVKRPAQLADQTCFKIQKQFRKGIELLETTPPSIADAIALIDSTFSDFKNLDEPNLQLSAYFLSGGIYSLLQNRPKSLERFQEGLKLARQTHQRNCEIHFLSSIAEIQRLTNKTEEAMGNLKASIEMARNTGLAREEGLALNSQGNCLIDRGEYAQAISSFQTALECLRSVKDCQGQALALNNLGHAFENTGESRKSLESKQQALGLSRSAGDKSIEALVLNNIGVSFKSLGLFKEALDHYDQSLRLSRKIGDKGREGVVLSNLGSLYSTLGVKSSAEYYFQDALKLRRQHNDIPGIATTLSNLGNLYLASENRPDLEYALSNFEQALAALQKGQLTQTNTYIGITIKAAEAKYRLGRWEEAQSDCRTILERQLPNQHSEGEGNARLLLGKIHIASGQKAKAIDQFTSAVEIFHNVENPIPEIAALYCLALAAYSSGEYEKAKTEIERAIVLTERLRSLLVEPEFRTSFLARWETLYKLSIEILIQLYQKTNESKYLEMALTTTERARSRRLVEAIKESGAQIRNGAPPELLEAEQDLTERLSAKEIRYRSLKNKKGSEASALLHEITELQTQYQKNEGLIRKTSPRLAALHYPEPLTVQQIEQQLEGIDVALLEYSLGETASYLWVVTADSISLYTLPCGESINDLVGKVNSQFAQRAPIMDVKRKLQLRELQILSDILLKPISHLAAYRRLIIVGDEGLLAFPFGTLPDPFVARPASLYHPLMENHTILQLPSMTLLAALRTKQEPPIEYQKKIAVFADPVFSANDKRVNGAQDGLSKDAVAVIPTSKPPFPGETTLPPREPVAPQAVVLMRGNQEGFPTQFERLVTTRAEAESIIALAKPENTSKFLDFNATRTNALKADLKVHEWVHFASHGFLSDLHPALSGLVLTTVNQAGGFENGFLRIADIYNMNLPVEMVVLSACQTGTGYYLKGEGLLSVTRAFIHAGAKRVVASLWSVGDTSTQELMRRFYFELLKNKRSPSEALHYAQLSMFQHNKWKEPFYWAGFILQGEW